MGQGLLIGCALGRKQSEMDADVAEKQGKALLATFLDCGATEHYILP